VSATGAVRVGTHRTGVVRGGAGSTGIGRTSTHRTGVVRGGAGRTTAARAVPQRSVPQRSVPQRSVPQRSVPQRSKPPRSVPVRPDLKVVPTPARDRRAGTRSWRAPYVLLVLALLIGTTLSLLVLNTAIAVDSLKATTLRQENAHRAQEVQRLQQQVVDGSTPSRLAGEATSAGLVPAGTPGYLVVEPDGTSTLRGTPGPAPAPASPPPAVPPAAAVPPPGAGGD
jgi:hypothetical protein